MPLTPPLDRPHVAAFIDLGTNSARLLVVRIEPGHVTTALTQQKEVIRLGEGEFADGHELQEEAMERAIVVCRKFVELARSLGAERIVAAATSATREARNRAVFLRRLEAETGLQVHVVSGKEEARLIYLGLANAVHLAGQRAIFVDIGGGSTEVIVGDQNSYDFLDTISTGAIRLTSRVLPSDFDGPVDRETYAEMRRLVRHAAVHAVQGARRHTIDTAIGSSGTITNLATIAGRAFHPDTYTPGDPLERTDLEQVAALLRSLPLEERRKVSGLSPARADIIVAGAAILETLMEELDLTSIRPVTDVGVREGLLVDHLDRIGGHPGGQHLSVRERSVLQLGRTFGFDEAHARRVSRLALELFDSAEEENLHAYGPQERELLGYAALLHDIGAFLSFSNHHAHTYYLVRNADLLGFDQDEIALMAAVAYFHRKGQPSARHEAYAQLDADGRKSVKFLSTLVRLAENLDRSQTGSVAHARLRKGKRKSAVLEIEPAKECQLEVWAVEARTRHFEKGLGRRLTIEVAEQPPSATGGAAEDPAAAGADGEGGTSTTEGDGGPSAANGEPQPPGERRVGTPDPR